MLETTDTTRPKPPLTPEGTFQLVVKEIPTKKPTKKEGLFYFTFKFSFVYEDKVKTHTEFLMPWDMKPLLLAFGFNPEPNGTFVWDRYECFYPKPKSVTATIVHQADKSGELRARMTDIKQPALIPDEIPF